MTTTLNILTWLLMLVTWVFIIRGNRHLRVAAYFKGRADECEMQMALVSFPPEMRGEIHRMMLRNQLGEYLGHGRHPQPAAVSSERKPIMFKKTKQQPTILDCGHVDTGAGCATIGCPNVRIDPSWDYVDRFCVDASPAGEDGLPFLCTLPFGHGGWHIAEGYSDQRGYTPPGRAVVCAECGVQLWAHDEAVAFGRVRDHEFVAGKDPLRAWPPGGGDGELFALVRMEL